MTVEYLFYIALTVALLGYLLYSLLRPERF